MKHFKHNTTGIVALTFLIALFMPLLFSPLEQTTAYFAHDFLHQLENGSPRVRTLRSSRGVRPQVVRSQRNRERTRIPVSSTVKYKEQQSTEVNTNKWLYDRSQALLQICADKFPGQSLLCFQRNKRLLMRTNLSITEKNVY